MSAYPIKSALLHPVIAIQGAREFRSSIGMTWDDDAKNEAYDFGRELAHRLTFRKWDHAAWDYCYSAQCEKETIWHGEYCSSCGRQWGYPL
jgi:hypothetical protein